MKYTCLCLNFIIDSRGGAEPVDKSTKEELSNRAQSQELILVTYESLMKRIDTLIGSTKINDWTEFHCRNCDMWMYSCRTKECNSPDAKLIINKSAMSTPYTIDKMKEDRKYSPIFKIIIFYENNPILEDALAAGDCDVESLHPIARSWLQQQTELAESNIRNFADKQYAELEKKRSRARSEHFSICRAAATDGLRQAKLSQTTGGTGSQTTQKPRMIDYVMEFDESMLFESSPRTSRTSHDSIGSEGSDEDTLLEEPLPGRNLPELSMARSLPIPVPQFLEESQRDDRHDKSPQTPSDIAANIRALARSVHGDPIFGDLPRPRFTKD